ncbi:hypothetical protein KIL84_022505 [Mauremys mutica]|uniref:Uncharacterized protein n=1 Tax=Mauremys mutica TaxID=74926 RepID=A0A9D3WNP1_9SAUR|nr:hypothetical protein KIL84_022505 [Mauremys mutica]
MQDTQVLSGLIWNWGTPPHSSRNPVQVLLQPLNVGYSLPQNSGSGTDPLSAPPGLRTGHRRRPCECSPGALQRWTPSSRCVDPSARRGLELVRCSGAVAGDWSSELSPVLDSAA